MGGVPAVELTVAVNVIGCPTSEGLSEETSVVVVAAMMISLSAGDVLAELLPSPLYFAEIE